MSRSTPAPATAAPAPEFEAELTKERYYLGSIVKLHEGSQRGVVRGASGRLIPFSFAFVTMVGPRRRFSDLQLGLQVGYDVSHTAHGLRISAIRIPEEPIVKPPASVAPPATAEAAPVAPAEEPEPE